MPGVRRAPVPSFPVPSHAHLTLSDCVHHSTDPFYIGRLLLGFETEVYFSLLVPFEGFSHLPKALTPPGMLWVVFDASHCEAPPAGTSP
jgi:hypothetical protein